MQSLNKFIIRFKGSTLKESSTLALLDKVDESTVSVQLIYPFFWHVHCTVFFML